MRIVIRGVVQGVGFRPAVFRVAKGLGAHGYVQNNGSNVVIEVDGDAGRFMKALREALPPLARIDSVETAEGMDDAELKEMGFVIRHSESGARGVGIPTDSALCDRCREEMFSPGTRRHLFPFTNCTDCGARFTVIEDLPYDREKTSMRDFLLCADCRKEYEDPCDRRFHHQTISCPACGPRYRLLDADGSPLAGDPAQGFAALLQQGRIGIIKSWGGMHLCCTLATLPRMRQWYRRKEKPFAIMVRDMEAARRYARPGPDDERLLSSTHRPIVLVDKLDNEMAELISPGLGNIGLFLPYTEMQAILFQKLSVDALVMTSANVPGEPMVLRDEDSMQLGAEAYLLHDRRIVNRCDDSVMRICGGRSFYIRKSRGSIPSPMPFPLGGTAIGVGAQESVAGALAFKGELHATQYIGDASSAGVLDFLSSSLRHLRRLLEPGRIDAVGMDMHPGYSTRRLAREMADDEGCHLQEVQHHHAHAAALLADSGMEELTVLTLDGTGYGDDGTAWGGEVLHSTFKGYERVGHLQPFPLLGGEKAVHDIRRLAFALEVLGGGEPVGFGEEETTVFRKMMRTAPMTSSFGRVLDAIAFRLGICHLMTYDGEPAMKLERHLGAGRVSRLEAEVRDGVVMTAPLFARIGEMPGGADDRAASVTCALLDALVGIAAARAEEEGADAIGLTGGVSYDRPVCAMVEEQARKRGLRLVLPSRTPNGDGCIATGQCAVALANLRS
jgi:hydrogenase maturation protein HypF